MCKKDKAGRETDNCRNQKGLKTDSLSITDFIENRPGETTAERPVYLIHDYNYYECINSWITPETIGTIKAVFLTIDTNQLFFPGSWSEQPFWFVEAYEICKNEVALWQEINTPKPPKKR